ncbi:hypothetical protein HOLleu_18678 [Holothuria leucospilota]|uniref:Uncharacterized protein n=1 Tax=Holothuria leucospilota TaxID=206669 RepID=A0A9Q1C429_HOLLE|nr:hypothetical protein HOLleu_18678 [Holothuria leucospilota]
MWLAYGIGVEAMYGLREESLAESRCSSDGHLEPYARPVIANEIMKGVNGIPHYTGELFTQGLLIQAVESGKIFDEVEPGSYQVLQVSTKTFQGYFARFSSLPPET